ncbi:MAG: glycosyltransferase family 4 protein [Candidatus Brocadia sp.]|nr:glycosyltransferase family 4 protein [Candidatus Brocadia sp.]
MISGKKENWHRKLKDVSKESDSQLQISNQTLKICVLGTRGFPQIQGGVESHCENLYPHLVKKGCKVIVFTRKPYVNTPFDTYQGVKLIPLFSTKNKLLEAFLHTFVGIFAARMFSPDILHIHAIGPSLFIPVARLLGLKVIMTNHGPDYQRKKWGKLAKSVLKLGEILGSKWANGIICISESIGNRIKEKYKKDVSVIPNGVTIPEILYTEVALKKYTLQKGKYLLAVGRFVPEKGFHDLIEAFNQFSSLNSQPSTENWKLVIVGRADHEDKYSVDLKEKASKNKKIVLTGFLKGVPLHELYSNAGLFVLPSYYEGLPIVLLEAMSYGLSCIASDIPANKNVELCGNRFFKAGDINALCTKIKEFIDNPLTEEGKSKQVGMIAEKYNWERISEKTMKVYRKIFN